MGKPSSLQRRNALLKCESLIDGARAAGGEIAQPGIYGFRVRAICQQGLHGVHNAFLVIVRKRNLRASHLGTSKLLGDQ
ncbi:hypothetical protein, partial [Gordonibacter sp.]|uniref:hypothetical protein n=1 Tax=Gordonibacter sp. TaxID=1968902 RepID=UPI002FC6394E